MKTKEEKWIQKETHQKEKVKTLAKKHNISEIAVKLLLTRINEEDFDDFLSSEEKNLYPAKKLKNVDKAVERILMAVKSNENITIFGDYDVDGTTGTSIFIKALNKLKNMLNSSSKIDYYIPSRKEGYGLNESALEKLAKNNELIITVDLGVSEGELIKQFSNKVDIIVTDHHTIDKEKFPTKAYTVINAKQGKYPDENICGSLTAYKVSERLFQKVTSRESLKLTEIIPDTLELAIVATVADSVQLLNENRTIVKKYINLLESPSNLGLKALMSKLTHLDVIDEGTIGFGIGPLINAVNRMTNNVGEVVELFTTHNKDRIVELAEKFAELNDQRKDETIEQQNIIEKIIEENNLQKDNVIIVGGENVKVSLAGIIASRIAEKYTRPTIVIDLNTLKGSARSINDINVYDIIYNNQKHLSSFGGHEMAAGLSIEEGKIDLFREEINNWVEKNCDLSKFQGIVKYDMEINLEENNLDLMRDFSKLKPFGSANESPVFLSKKVKVADVIYLSEGKHVKLMLQKDDLIVDALMWYKGDETSERLQDLDMKNLWADMIYSPEINYYRGKSVQLNIDKIQFYEAEEESDEVEVFLQKMIKQKNIMGKEKYRGIEEVASFNTKIVGVSFDNRQEHIMEISDSDLARNNQIELKREPENEYDENAILVLYEGKDLGYLNKDLAKKIAPKMDEGVEYNAIIEQITDNYESENGYYGVNVSVYTSEEEKNTKGKLEHREKFKKEFSELNYWESIKRLKTLFLGEDAELYEEQKQALKELNNNNSMLTIMGTGRGKSIIFQLYAAYVALKENKNSIFVYPLKALINDQKDSIRKMMKPLGISVRLANGDLSKKQKDELFDDMQKNNVDIVLATPEFLNYYKMVMKNNNTKFLVVDEGHYLAKNRSGYKSLDKTVEYLNVEKVYITTATCPNKYYTKINKKFSIEKLVKDTHTRENLKIVDKRDELDVEMKKDYLKKLLYTDQKTIVYFNSKRQAMDTMEVLHKESENNYKVGFYHGDMTRNERKKVEGWFKEGKINMIMATSAFGEGVNIKDIRHIVLYHPNFTTTDFNQQSGRGGRDGKESKIHMIFNEEDYELNESIVNIKFPRQKLIAILLEILKIKFKKRNELVMKEKTIIHYCNKYLNGEKTSEMELETAFKIVEEAGIITFFRKEEDDGNQYIIKDWDLTSRKKSSIVKTPSYLEGKAFKEDFELFKEFMREASLKEIISGIQQPIFPSKIKKEKVI